MTARAGDQHREPDAGDRAFWSALFSGLSNPALDGMCDREREAAAVRRGRGAWIDRLFAGEASLSRTAETMSIARPSVEIDDAPGYPLHFDPASLLAVESEDHIAFEESAEIPSGFSAPPPPASPTLVNFLDDRASYALWSGGVATLKVAEIIEETHDVKTFRLVGQTPTLFSYRPGQLVTLRLDLDGEEVQRAYSLSSSPSRPHVLELTVKRVPGGRVSNWLCDHVRPGQMLTLKGP